MKVLYSQIKELVPDLKASPKEVGETLTMSGFMMDSFVEVVYKGAKDYLIGLEIRQNRADCLSVIGLAREVAAFYGFRVSIPSIELNIENKTKLNIKIKATDYVKRVLAIKLSNIKNSESPDWLKEYLAFYGLNSINLLVDLSNYVMLITGYPSHLIDLQKTDGQISWSLNNDFNKMVTLFGSHIVLQKNTELIIRDKKNILALAGIVGGKIAAIDLETKSMIVEIAVYNRSIIRKNSRNLNITTEASHRLEKDLDPNSADYAIKLLVSLFVKYTGGKISSDLFDYYPKKHTSPCIKFDTDLPSKFAGIKISEEDIFRIFKNLNFTIKKTGRQLLVEPPTYRLDLSIPEDLVEEVLRIYGYNRIPTNEIPKLEIIPNITPKNIVLSEKIRDILNIFGFDEILSCPLTKKSDNEFINYIDWDIVMIQNSVNDIYPNLRQSIIIGLLNQLNEYAKNNVDFINIFEIGKIFGAKAKKNKYIEYEALGVISTSNDNNLTEFKNKIESLLRLVGLNDIKYFDAKFKPKIANSKSCWDIYIGKHCIGIIYKLIPQEVKLNVYFAEINIAKTTESLLNTKNNPVVEITQKLIALDANVELNANESIFKYLKKLEDKFDKNCLWSINISDVYSLKSKVRYTIRVTYKELSDQEAKEVHQNIFNPTKV